MEVRSYNSGDYKHLSDWWLSHSWDPVPERFLPSLGFVVDEGEKMLCAGFLYIDGNMGFMEWIVSNPENTPRESLSSIMILVKHVCSVAVDENIAIFSSVKNPGLISIYKKCGFLNTDEQMTNMVFTGG